MLACALRQRGCMWGSMLGGRLSNFAATRRQLSSADATANLAQEKTVANPSKQQLQIHALASGVPMVGFGIVDCVVMTQVGSTMDAVLGASLGISSITAAAIGLFCSDSCGVLFGGQIESLAQRMGLPRPGLTTEQLEMPASQRAATLGRLFGVQLGVLIGSISLLFAPSPKPCPVCNKPLKDSNGSFCSQCGAKVVP
mmetsp:Transcript_36798/g.70777  ORF Transcript_36798/g.70777 Transcript_36798/m.70777 type:complete len:198 (+) Transcript_36798:109-702(+)